MWDRVLKVTVTFFVLIGVLFIIGAATNDLGMLDFIVKATIVAVPLYVFMAIASVMYDWDSSHFRKRYTTLINLWLLFCIVTGIVVGLITDSLVPFGFGLAVGLGAPLLFIGVPSDGSTYERPEY